MKKILILSLGFLVVGISSCKKSNLPADGYWQGTIMARFTIILDIKQVGDNLQGRIYGFDGDFIFQDDTLQDFMFKDDSLFFYIPDKETRFAGLLTENSLDGHLIFKEGEKTPAVFQRKHKDELAEAGFLPNVAPPASVLEKRYGLEELLADYDQYIELLKKSHPALYAYQTEEEFTANIERIRGKIKDGMTTHEFAPIIMEIGASIGCSHTRVRPSRKVRMAMERYSAMLPIQFRLKQGQLSIEKGVGIDPALTGSTLISINDMPTATIVSQLMSIIPAENGFVNAKEYEFNRYQTSYLPFILFDSTFAVSVSMGGQTLDIQPKSLKVLELPWQSSDVNPEWTLQNIHSKQAALLTIPTFAFPDPLMVPNWLDSVFTLIEEEDVKTLIIDIRGNEGGPPYPARILLSYLIDRPFAYFASTSGIPEDVEDLAPLYQALPESPRRFKGKVIVLSDAGVMSTAGHFVSLISYFKAGKIAGQAPGSHMACNDNTYEVVLTNTGIECAIPRTRFVTNISGLTPKQILVPDLPFDCCSGIPGQEEDPLMDYLLDKVLK